MASSVSKHLSKIRSPLGGEKVYKDECIFSFDTPLATIACTSPHWWLVGDQINSSEPVSRMWRKKDVLKPESFLTRFKAENVSYVFPVQVYNAVFYKNLNKECETGLYVCMNSFLGFGKAFVERYYQKTGNAVYLHLRRIKKEIPESEEVPKKKPTRLAIGVEGGFDTDEKKYEIEEINSICVLPEWTEITLPNPDLPGEIIISATAILATDSAAKQEEAAAFAGQWEGVKKVVSKHADNLLQLDNPKKIPPSGWKCEKCDKTDNLWLNLTDGSILCGRKFWDGSGGNNHALEHYEEVKYPLAVKLGTITPDGADVYSYDEDEMVEDPHLAKHLAHFGIDIMKMEKTDKTMMELEIDANQKIMEWDIIQESGSKLQPLYGPGYTGIHNLGNSCYMNSVMQVLFSIPDFVRKYYEPAESIFENASADPTNDFTVQMAKFGCGLLSGNYSKPPEELNKDPLIKYPTGIKPYMFKALIGRGHPEFSTKRQQDAQEFLLHIINMIERNSYRDINPTDCFRYEVEERIECVQSGKVKYTKRMDYLLALPIPMEAATNLDEVAAFEAKKKQLQAEKKVVDPKDVVRPHISLKSCLEAFAAPELIDDFYSSALKTTSTAKKTTRLATFPDYLMIQMKKFTLGDDWVPMKLDVSLEMPDELDLSDLRGKGLQPGEVELPEGDQQTPVEPQIDASVVNQLVDMGFSREGCKRAVYNTNNSGIEPAMNWVMEHMNDPDFSAPFQVPASSGAKKMDNFVANEDAVAMITSMGFTYEQAIKALKATNNNVERAADWIFSHADELDQPMETDQDQPEQSTPAKCRDGNSKYKLVAFISHMGTSTLVGHYVCHILKEGRWVIYNDEKVALSEHPPKDLAYLYLYQRI